MKNGFIACGLAAALFVAGSAQADVGVAAGVGTTGGGLQLSFPLISSSLNARFGVNAFNYSYSGNTSDVDYDIKLKLQTGEALLDWFPFSGRFRLSTGVVFNGNKIDAKAKSNSSGTYTFNGHTYTAADAGTVAGRIDFRKTAPYLGIGWGNPVAKDKGFGLFSDLGVIFQGAPKTTMNHTGCTLPDCTQLDADIDAERRNLEDDLKAFKAYPVIRVGISYRF